VVQCSNRAGGVSEATIGEDWIGAGTGKDCDKTWCETIGLRLWLVGMCVCSGGVPHVHSTRALLDRCAELLGGWLVLTRLDFDLPQEGFDFKVADTTPIGGGFRGQEWPFLLCEAPNSLEGSSLGGMELPEDVVALCAQISDTRSLQILVEVATYLAAGTGAWVEFNTFSPLDGDGCVQMMEPISYPTHTVYSYAVTADWLAVRGSGVGPILM